MDKDSKYKSMTQMLRLTNSDDDVGNYIRWIIKSDTAKEYWQSVNQQEMQYLKDKLELAINGFEEIESIPYAGECANIAYRTITNLKYK